MSGFKITAGKGFHVTFANGYTVSVQWGPGNYCDNYNDSYLSGSGTESGKKGSSTAECAVWGPDGGFIKYDGWGGDTVSNRSTPEEVLELLNWAARQTAEKVMEAIS